MPRKNDRVRERKMPKAAQPKKGQRRPHRKVEDKADAEFAQFLAQNNETPRQ